MLLVKQGEGSEWFSTPISLLLFLSLPSINPSSLLLHLLLLLQLYIYNFSCCYRVSSSWEKHRGFSLAGKLWPPVGVRQVATSVNKTKQSITLSPKKPFQITLLWCRGFSKDPSCWIIVRAGVEKCYSFSHPLCRVFRLLLFFFIFFDWEQSPSVL